jgi:hypothetical protein
LSGGGGRGGGGGGGGAGERATNQRAIHNSQSLKHLGAFASRKILVYNTKISNEMNGSFLQSTLFEVSIFQLLFPFRIFLTVKLSF